MKGKKVINLILALLMVFSIMTTSVSKVYADTVEYNDGTSKKIR